MECLLPSEIARLVFGYLEEQKCEEAAQCFLEHSTFLSECLNVVRAGRKFSSRVQGSSLLDILDEYCAVQSLVAERIRKLPESSSEQLQNCGGLVEKLKILLDNAKSGQTVAVSISVLPHSGASQGNSAQGALHNRSRVAQSAHERKRSIRFQGQENKQKVKEREERNVSIECSVETTRLETLPGLSGQGSRSAQSISDRALHPLSRTNESTFHISENVSSRTNSEENFYSNFASEQYSSEKGRSHSFSSTSTIPDKDTGQDINVNICEPGTSSNTCSKRKTHNKKKCTPSKSSPLRVRKTLRGDEEEEDEEEEESVAATLHRALLNNTELHEKIAENINSVIRIPNDLGSNEMSCGPVGSEDCEGVIQELNNAIKMVVDKTQEDPVFERLLEEIIGPTDEDMSSSPTGVESETDDACDAPDALICDEDFIISKGEVNSVRNSAVATTLSQSTLTLANNGNQNSVVNSVVEASCVVSSVSAVQNVVSDKGKCENHEVPVSLNNVDENTQTNSESLTINNKSLKGNVDKLSKKSCLPTSQTKGKSSSANCNVASQDNETSVGMSIHKEVRALLENASSDTVNTPKSDIPLKQRLRSARKSDTSSQGTTKETSSVDRSLEDQNAKAIQLILEANKKSLQLLETENIANSNDELSSKDVNKNSSSTSPKIFSEVSQKSSNSNNEKDVITREKSTRKESQAVASTIGVAGSESNVNINTAEELNTALGFDAFTEKPTQNSVLVEERCDIVHQTNVEKEQIMMLTIPSVMNPSTSTSSVVSQSRTEQITTRSSVASIPQTSFHDASNLQTQVMFSQQQVSEHLPPPFSVLTLSQNVNESAEGSRKQLIMDEANSSAVIVCDSNVTFPSFQFLKGTDTKENQPKKVRPIAPRPIRPKPATSAFPLQLITTDITPQYFVTQVSPTPLIERRNTIPPLSPGLLNVLNLTVPVISQTNEPVKKICVCTSEDCGKECVEITENNINLVLSSAGTNSDIYVESDISSVSEHVADNSENGSTNRERVVETAHQSTFDVCESNNENGDGPTASNANQSNQQFSSSSSKSKHNQLEISDMSSLLLLPEQMPKPRDTPQEFIAGKSGANTRRLSLSTPRRRTSHIRALDFGTPQKSGTESLALKKCQTSPKPSKPNIDGNGTISKVGFSTSPYKPSNKQVRSVRSSLFTSPDPPVDKKDGKKSSKENSSSSHAIPIATRSPVTHLLGDWDKATGVGLIFNGVSPENSVTRNVDHRPTRITPKTLLFSPESESNSASDQNQTPPSQNVSDSNKNNDLKQTESSEPKSSLPDIGTKNDDLNLSSPKGSCYTMPIKQKLKSRSWDEDLRKLLSKDFEDVYVQRDSLSKETHDSAHQNKATGSGKSCKRNQAKKKLKTRCVKRNNRKNALDGEVCRTPNASKSENRDLNKAGLKEKDSINNQDNAFAGLNNNIHAKSESEKDKSREEERRNNCSDMPADIKANFIKKKRKADEIPENCLPKRPKHGGKEENEVKTVEEVLESMFCEDNENSADVDGRPKGKETDILEHKTRNVCDVLVLLNSTEEIVTETSKAPLQTENDHHSNKSIFDLEDTPKALEKSREPATDSKVARIKHGTVKDNLIRELPQLPVNRTDITTGTSNSLEKSHEVSEQNNFPSASKKTATNLEKNINLETPIKNDKYLSKNLNPTTPGPIDGLFPMTPRVLSPSHQEETPMTKLLRSEPCINFSMIVTPSLPPTPNIMISPCSESQDSPTSYASRPTDYSSCSSYYNPSKSVDTPTKLEQELIKECNKMEQNKKKAQDKLDKSKENLESTSRNIALGAKSSRDKEANVERGGFPKEQSHFKDISTSQEENESLNSNSSSFVSVSGTEESESNNTEKTSHLSYRKVGQQHVETNVKQASLENISGPKNHLTDMVKKTFNAKNKPLEKVALSDQIESEGNEKGKDLSVQTEDKITEENKVENRLKTSKSKLKDVPKLCVNDLSQSHIKDARVSNEISVQCNSKESHIPVQNEPKKSILQEALEKGKEEFMRNKSIVENSKISQDEGENVHCEKSSSVTSEEISKHCEDSISGGEADRENTHEELINENHSRDSNKENSGKGFSKTVHTNTTKDENDTKKNMYTSESAKREIRPINQSSEMISEIKEQFARNEINKKGQKSTQTQRRNSYLPMNASDSLLLSNDDEDNNVTETADGENGSALKFQRINNVSNVQIHNKDNTEQLENKPSNLHETILSTKKTEEEKMEDTNAEENKAISSQKVIRKHVEGHDSSKGSKNKNKINPVQDEAINVKSRTERQKGMKNTPKVTEIVRYFVSKTPSKSPRSLSYKSKDLTKKSIEHKEIPIKKKAKPEGIPSEKNGSACGTELNKIKEDSSIELVNKTQQCEKMEDEKSDKRQKEFMKSSGNVEKNEESESIEIADQENKNKNVDSNEHETVHQEIDIDGVISGNKPPENVSDDYLSEKDKEGERKNEDQRLCKENREVQIQNKVSVPDVHVLCDEIMEHNQEEIRVSHKCEDVNMTTKSNSVCLSPRRKNTHGNDNIRKENLESRHSEKENTLTSVYDDSLNTNRQSATLDCTSASVDTTSIVISKRNSTEVLKISEIEHLSVKSSSNFDHESSKQIDSSASVEELDYEREEENETSSSESDSDESSEDSCSDSSDESSIDTSQSQDSFVKESDKVTGLQEDNITSLRDESSEDILTSENRQRKSEKTHENKDEHSLGEQSCSESINEILKTASSASCIRQDMCFASELDEKKKRTLARLKGSSETDQTSKNTNNTASKNGQTDEVPVCQQPVSCEPSQVTNERRVEERNWDESSIEEFPVLHLSDSESAGNATPRFSPVKSVLIDTDFEKLKHDSLKSNLASNEISPKRIRSPTKDAMAHTVNRISTKIFKENCENDGKQKSEVVVPESELSQNKDEVPVIEACSVPNINPFVSENTNCRDDNLENTESPGDSIVESVMRMNENELFLKICYTGNFCPTPKAINHTNFCYSLNEDDNEITIVGSQFQSLMEIPSKKDCDKPNCSKHVKDRKSESACSKTKTNVSIKENVDNQEFGDSISDRTILLEEKDKQSSKMRPLDALYEEMIRCNDSSSMSDENDALFTENTVQKSKGLSTVKCAKKKTTGSSKSHQGSLKVSESGQKLLQENMRYQSPLEMISEYKSQKEKRRSNCSVRTDSKTKDHIKSKKDANHPERQDKGELEEGEILDSPHKESTSSGSMARRGDSSRHVYRSGYRRSESSDGSFHSHSSHRSKTRSSESARRESYSQHHRNEKHQTSSASSHHDDVRSLPPKKRKAVSDETIKECEKRVRHDNPCKLLKNLNIDSFLNKVHGEDPCK